MSQSNHTNKLAGLEIIRALAATLVVYNHLFTFGLLPRSHLFELPAQFATEAVIVFFVLSGTVITLTAERRSKSAPTPFAAARDYLQARMLRIYPIYFLGLGLASIAQRHINGTSMSTWEIIGNVLFLQTLGGYIVAAPPFNLPLWSLANEFSYYLLFAIAFYFPHIGTIWAISAFACIFLVPPPYAPGIVGHLAFVLSLSLPWLTGHWIASSRHRLPEVSTPLGIAFLVIGLVYARISVTNDYFDPFRLTAFAACSAPLVLSIIQNNPRSDQAQHHAARAAVASAGIAALWLTSSSLFSTKCALTITAIVFAAIHTTYIERAINQLSALGRPLTYLGSISYAIYALHTPVLLLVRHLFGAAHWGAQLVISLACVLTLAHLVERKLQPWLARRIRSKTALPNR